MRTTLTLQNMAENLKEAGIPLIQKYLAIMQHTQNKKKLLESILTKDQGSNDSNEVETSRKSLR